MDIPAMFIVHWPGKDVPACPIHAAKLKDAARAMGFNVSFTLAQPDSDEMCSNCKNVAGSEDDMSQERK